MLKKTIIHFMKNISGYENIFTNRFYRRFKFFASGIIEKRKLYNDAQKTIQRFGVEFPSQADEEKLISDMLKMNRLYGFGFDEYLLYGFTDRSKNEKLAFVADWEHTGYANAMNDSKNNVLFDNKWKTYQKYKIFYQRDAVYCAEKTDKDQFISFMKKHDSIIVKPIADSCGRGIKIIREGGSADLYENLMNDYKGGFVAEELIRQSEEMAKFHPSSVNTIRVPTIRFDDGVQIIHPFMRIGQKGNYVDNAGSGGIICLIDPETHTIIEAVDELGQRYSVHPDTKEQIIGFQIPRWDELKQFANRLAQVVPENRYTSWDLALTDNGWVMVEGNRRGQFVGWQITSQVGFRKELNDIMDKLGHKY